MTRIFKSIPFEANSVILDNIERRLASTIEIALSETPIDTARTDQISDGGVITETETEVLLNEAQQHVEMMLDQARIQVTTWQEEARQEGWQTGYTEARQTVEADLLEALTTARNLAQAAKEAYDEFLHKNQAELGQLAVAIAEKIIGNELSINPNAITDIVTHVVKTVAARGTGCIRVNPQDYESVKPYWETIPLLQSGGQNWELVPDQHINQGGCMIETGGGIIDAQLETQLEQVAAAFRI